MNVLANMRAASLSARCLNLTVWLLGYTCVTIISAAYSLISTLYSNAAAPIIVFFVTCVVMALLTAAGIAVALLARSLPAVIAAFLTAVAPDCVGANPHDRDRVRWVVARDDEFAGPWAFFGGFVKYDDREARTGMQRRRKGIINQFPMAVLVFERNARDIQLAIAHVTDRNRTLFPAARLHATDVG